MVARAVDNEAPYFVDYIGEVLDATFPGIVSKPGTLDVYTTLDLNLQRHAQDAVREGIAVVDKALARRKRGPARVAQAALVAIDPRSGEILAFIGGRSYNQSQFNRAVSARRQIGSTFKPFVYLAAFEKAADEGTGDITPASLVYRRAHHVELRQPGVVAEELRRRIRRRHHAAARAGHVAQHRRGESRRADRLRAGSWRCGSEPGLVKPIR